MEPILPQTVQYLSLFLISLWNTAFDLQNQGCVHTVCQSWISYFSLFPFGLGPSIHFPNRYLDMLSKFSSESLESLSVHKSPSLSHISSGGGWARVGSALPPLRWPQGAPRCARHDRSTFRILEFASTSLKCPSRFGFSSSLPPYSAGLHPAALSATREDCWACFYHLLCLQPSVRQSCHAGVDRDPCYPWGHQPWLSQPGLQLFSNFKRHLSHL